MLRSRITGVGHHVPPRAVTNADLEEPLHISARSIERRTGILKRYWNDDPDLGTSDLAVEATRKALASAGLVPDDVDMIVFATLSPDAAAPGSGCFLQSKLRLPGIPTIDVRQQCSGFLYGLSIADLYVRAGQCRNVLLVGAEMQSKLLDMTPRGRKVTTLFGDGAGAAIVSAADVEDDSDASRESFVLSVHLHSDGTHGDHLLWQHPGTMNATFLDPTLLDEPESHPQMLGRELYDICLDVLPAVSREALDAHGYTADDVDLFVIHQTNMRMNREYAQLMGVPLEKVFCTVQDFGNTTAATIPIGLSEAVRQGRLEPGMLVLSCTFGSGLSWASALYRW
jgi:3-oxoacyl-[acyl-carrier-protein] synthase-3